MKLKYVLLMLCISTQASAQANEEQKLFNLPPTVERPKDNKDMTPALISDFDLTDVSEFTLKLDPLEFCSRVTFCAKDDKDSADCDATGSSVTLLPSLHIFSENGKQDSNKKMDDLLLVFRQTNNIHDYDISYVGSKEKLASISLTKKLRVKTPSLYCRIDLAPQKGMERVPATVPDQGVMLIHMHHDKKTLTEESRGPLYKGGEKLNDVEIKVKADSVGDSDEWCAMSDEFGDFVDVSTPAGAVPRFGEGPFYRYNVINNGENGCKQHSIVLEFINKQLSEDINYGEEMCRGFSLCFQKKNTAKGDRMCIDKTATIEIYPMNMLMIGPDSALARPLRVPRTRLHHFRFTFFNGMIAVSYDPLNGEQDGSVEYFKFAHDLTDKSSEMAVDIVTDGYCPLRLATDYVHGQCQSVYDCLRLKKDA